MNIFPATEFGKRAAYRLKNETIIWLTTVDSRGYPQTRPVWFFWDGGSIQIYSRPQTAKLRHIARSPKVSLNLDGDGKGGDIIVITGVASLSTGGVPANEHDEYCRKYKEGFKRIGMTPEQFSQTYSEIIRIAPVDIRGH